MFQWSKFNFTTFWKQKLKVTAGRSDHDMVLFDPLVHPERKRLQKRKVHLCTEAHIPRSRYGQYLAHAHNHITRAVAAMNSCFASFGVHQAATAWVIRF